MSIVSYAGPNLLFFFVVLERFWITGESHTLRFLWLVLFKTSPLLHCKSRIQSRKLLWKKRQKWGVPFYKLHSQKTNMKHNSFGLPFHFYCVLSTTVRSGKVNRNQCIFCLPSLFRCSLHHRPNVVDGGHCLCDFRRDFFAEFGPTEKKTYRKYTAMASRSIWTNHHKSISYIWDLNEWFKKLRSKSLETFQSLATKTMACNLSSFISLWINSTFPYIIYLDTFASTHAEFVIIHLVVYYHWMPSKTSKTWGIMPESGSNYQLLVGYALHGNQIRMNITKFWNGIFFWTWMMPDKITTTKMDRLSVEKNWITWWRRPAKFRFLFFSSRGSSSPAAGRIKKKSNLITLFLL